MFRKGALGGELEGWSESPGAIVSQRFNSKFPLWGKLLLLTVFKCSAAYFIACFPISNTRIANHSDTILGEFQQLLQDYLVSEWYCFVHHVITVVITQHAKQDLVST